MDGTSYLCFSRNSAEAAVFPGALAAWLRLPPVCPSEARVNPGRLSPPRHGRPLNGCLPQSANALAEAEGGSGVGAAPRHGSSTGAGSSASSRLPPALRDAVVTAWTHTHSRQTRGGGPKKSIFLCGSETTVCSVLVYWLTVKKMQLSNS